MLTFKCFTNPFLLLPHAFAHCNIVLDFWRSKIANTHYLKKNTGVAAMENITQVSSFFFFFFFQNTLTCLKIISLKLCHFSNTTKFVYYFCITITHSDHKPGKTTPVLFPMLIQSIQTSSLSGGYDLKHLYKDNRKDLLKYIESCLLSYLQPLEGSAPFGYLEIV